jgi:hypothetical protein
MLTRRKFGTTLAAGAALATGNRRGRSLQASA